MRSDPTKTGLNKDRFRVGRRAKVRADRLARDRQMFLPGMREIVASRPANPEKLKVARPRKRGATK